MSGNNDGRSVTLHDEIAAILRASGLEWMTTQELANEVTRAGGTGRRTVRP